jgi:hypothetical protein
MASFWETPLDYNVTPRSKYISKLASLAQENQICPLKYKKYKLSFKNSINLFDTWEIGSNF